MKRKYKSDILDCSNSVHSPGAICKECLDKLIDDKWCLNYCVMCNKIITLFTFKRGELYCLVTKFNERVCPIC
jgi:hypothetical protein